MNFGNASLDTQTTFPMDYSQFTPSGGGGGGFGMDFLGPLGMIGGSLISGIGGLFGSKSSKKEAEKNRQWQEYMSNTAHQREVRDLREAGLNPILSATKGAGASTPGGAHAAITNPLGEAGAGISSAAKTTWLEKQMIQANVEAAQADAEKKRREIPLVDSMRVRTLAEARKADQETATSASDLALKDALAREAGFKVERMGYQNTLDAATAALREAERALAITSAKRQDVDTDRLRAEIDKIRQEIRNMQADYPKKAVTGKAYGTLGEIWDAAGDAIPRAIRQIRGKEKLEPGTQWIVNQFKGAGTAIGEGANKVWGGFHRAGQRYEYGPDITP